MRAATRHFLHALQFFSRIPLPAKTQARLGFSPSDQAALLFYWPAVGVLIGGLTALLFLGLCTLLSLGLQGVSMLGLSLPGPGLTGLNLGLSTSPQTITPLAVLAPPRLPSASAFFVVALSLVTSLWLSGGIHEDGLADSADGLGSGLPRERALAIMQDPHCGSFAVLSLLAVWTLRLALFWQLCMLQPLWAAFAWVYAAVGSRSLPLFLVATLPYARSTGASKARAIVAGFDLKTARRAQVWWLATLFVIATTVALLQLSTTPLVALLPEVDASTPSGTVLFLRSFGIVLLGLILASMPAWLCLRHWRKRLQARLQGYTGDTLGAAQQLCELALLLGLLLMLLVL